MKNEQQDLRVILFSCQAISKTYIHKYSGISKDNNLMTKQFCENIFDYLNFLNNSNIEKNLISTGKFIEDWIRSSCSQMEIWYDNLKNLSEENSDLENKTKSLENNIHNISVVNEEKNILERKLTQKIHELQEENKILNDDVLALEQQCDKLVNDYKQVRNEIKKKLEEIGDLKHEIRELNNSNLKINNIIKDKENNQSYTNYQIQALEDRIIIISKEKKNLENLINRISKCHPMKEMVKLVNDMLNNYENISQLEREKNKIEESYKNLENKLQENNSISNVIGSNSDLIITQVKIEKENLRNLLEDLEKKLSKNLFLFYYFQ